MAADIARGPLWPQVWRQAGMQVCIAVVDEVMQRLFDVNAPGVFRHFEQQTAEVEECRCLWTAAGVTTRGGNTVSVLDHCWLQTQLTGWRLVNCMCMSMSADVDGM